MINMETPNKALDDSTTPESFDWTTHYHVEQLIGHKVDPFLIEAALKLRQQFREELWNEHGHSIPAESDNKAVQARAKTWIQASNQLAKEDDMRRNPHLYTSTGFAKHCSMCEFMPTAAICDSCPQPKAGRLCDDAPVARIEIAVPKKKKNKGWSPEARERVAAKRARKKNSGRRNKLIDEIIESNPDMKAVAEQDYSKAYDLAWDIAEEQIEKENEKKKK